MKKLHFLAFFLLGIITFSQAQDPNNPIDPSPTVGIWNRFYGDDFSRLQFLANMTYGKYFYRVTTELQFDYNGPTTSKGANFMVARLFQSKNGKNQYGLGAIVSYFNPKGFAGGVSFVSVSQLGNNWRFISLATVQGGDDIFSIEFQPGIYKDFERGWYFRGHPRMLFDLTEDVYEVPIGAGVGKIIKTDKAAINLFFEPQYDFAQTRPMLYMGIKTLF
ncbi:hypothetical protein [Algoriphagus sp.]|uniref:hypothetical protein n=1 Tax=Algoriphagus sp. TaxID=1872435 RepID=UPI0032718AC1